jgi:hypothetical protein
MNAMKDIKKPLLIALVWLQSNTAANTTTMDLAINVLINILKLKVVWFVYLEYTDVNNINKMEAVIFAINIWPLLF